MKKPVKPHLLPLKSRNKWFKDSHIGTSTGEKPPDGTCCLIYQPFWPQNLLKTHPQEWPLSEGENTRFLTFLKNITPTWKEGLHYNAQSPENFPYFCVIWSWEGILKQYDEAVC